MAGSLRYVDPRGPLVMHIVPTLESGGAERLVHDIAVCLLRTKFDVHVVSILRGGPLESLFRQDVPLTILGVRGPLGLRAIYELRKLMKRERPDVVHTHLFGADVGVELPHGLSVFQSLSRRSTISILNTASSIVESKDGFRQSRHDLSRPQTLSKTIW